MSAATAKIIDLSDYRRRRAAEVPAPVIPGAILPPMAWVPTLVFVPVLLVPMG